MRLAAKPLNPADAKHARAAFTLAEVLAALAFMAIVIPVAVEGVRVANMAGLSGLRRTVAMRLAERVLTESVLMSQMQSSVNSGTILEGGLEYRWVVQTRTWPEDTMREVTVVMTFPVQGVDHSVRVSTLTGTTSP